MNKKSKSTIKPSTDLIIPGSDLSSPSGFTLTFVIEVVDTDVWHDCSPGRLALGPPIKGVKLSYQLYPGRTFDVDVVIWSHVAKISCGQNNYGWVRTWQFLERRWLSFSICHVFPVRVTALRNLEMTVTPSPGTVSLAHAKTVSSQNLQGNEVYLPPLQFGVRRQFAEVVEVTTALPKYIKDIIWSLVEHYIPSSIMDGLIDTPYPVQDVRHQDAVLYQVRNMIQNRRERNEDDKENLEVVPNVQKSLKPLSKGSENKLKRMGQNTVERKSYEIKLSGDRILAGIGRVTPFVITGYRPEKEQGAVMALISCMNLPAHDDLPIFFVNVCNLADVPIEHFKQNGFTHIYTRWKISEEEHNSERQPIQAKDPRTEFNFNDHHSIPLPSAVASDVMARFLDEPFQLELRGIRIPAPVITKPTIFGYDKADHNFGTRVPPPIFKQDIDVLIAQTRIDATALTNINESVKGDFPLYPSETSVMPLEREVVCTNDVNAVRAKVKPELIIQPGVILEAQMTIEVSMGLVGCNPVSNAVRYSRLYCLVSDRDAIMILLREVNQINELIIETESKTNLLTGFALDTGDTVLLYVEGPRKGRIFGFWEKTEDFYPTVKPIFSTSAKYSCRLYPDLLLATMPFTIMKMAVPLSVLLGLAAIYARPGLPIPTRSAVLKIGRLIASKLESAPFSRDMPTAMELKSFRLELCVPPRPPSIYDQVSE